MKVKVLSSFRDRHNGKRYEVGEVLTISKARYNEILDVAPIVEEIKEKKKD